MSSARLFAVVAAAAILTACQTPGPPPPPPFREAPPSATVFRAGDFSWSAVPGSARIEGRLTYRAGPVRYTCQGMTVVLTPETLWTRRRMTILYNSPERAALPANEVRARTPSAPNDDYSAFVRRTTCDAADHFSFSGLPDGAWFVITVAKPVAAQGETMAIMRRVTTHAGRVTPGDL
ncbi:hypothetical protein [Phenylobacterium sp.]|uniref:hypothetical protein n=1 Tax=Phenylobacterium sp. TaxID=1871053 RepID=UPI0035B3ABA1